MFLCETCLHVCKQCKTKCVNYEHCVSEEELSELNYEIRRQNINLKRFCRSEGLKLYILKDMLKGKIDFSYKYLYKINSRLNEKDEWIKYIENNMVD